MAEEQSFLDALKANPADDTTRLVYADWLDEQARPDEAGYLRLVAALVPLCQEDDSDAGRQLLAVAERTPAEWRADAGGRFAVFLYQYDAWHKIGVIKIIRELTGQGLAEAKRMSEELPCRVVTGVTFERAGKVRGEFLRVASVVVFTHPVEVTPDQMPFIVHYQVVAGFSYWGTANRRPLLAEGNFRRFVQAELGVSNERAAEVCRGAHVVMADGLTLDAASAAAVELRGRLPLRVASPGADGRWSYYVSTRAVAVDPNKPT